ncbi:MAG: T9SS type A sorting domain-containing protein [Dysgonamonadaceae bacterium]|nr:T9SS type A sorting domain-containing protein [Dysgonamonadaceae bacterium]
MPGQNTTFSDFTAPASNVYYVVEIQLNEGCDLLRSSSTAIRSNVATNSRTGIDEVSAHAVSVFPNPVENELHINSETPIDRVEIVNLAGHAVAIETGGTPSLKRTINVSHLPQGVYLLKVHAGQGVMTTRFVKK